ncbi:unnamed protein product [Acanthoscelides obtectus]|uniref:Uncharacterized protein n=1 Tax=Acanthoscelides obtectus TaxID=200917 RepID=A0A9P0PCX1_ACAOB|nr:unnamed protein product [Acanthoscelides obtectus]
MLQFLYCMRSRSHIV